MHKRKRRLSPSFSFNRQPYVLCVISQDYIGRSNALVKAKKKPGLVKIWLKQVVDYTHEGVILWPFL